MKYRITVFTNRIPEKYNLITDFEKARQYHLKHGVDIEFIFNKIDVHGYQSTHNQYLNRWILPGVENLFRQDPISDTNMFVFDQAEWSTPAGSQYPLKPETPNGCCYVVGNRPFIQVGTHSTSHEDGQTWIQIAHEIMHSYRQVAVLKGYQVNDVMDTYRLNATPDDPNSNFSEQWKLLENYLKPMNYIYFKPNEITNLRPELVVLLDKARGISGVPFKITSGYRTADKNTEVGGKPTSSHLTGEAVDLSCSDSITRYKIITALLSVGFVRLEVCKEHIHCDISKTLPQNVIDFSPLA